MEPEHSDLSRFAELVRGYLDENLGDAERHELERLLLGDAALRREFYEQVEVHAAIDGIEESESSPQLVALPSPALEPNGGTGWERRLGVAAGLVAAALAVGWFFGKSDQDDPEVASLRMADVEPVLVAPPDPERRYRETMGKLGAIGSQNRPPGKSIPAVAGEGTLSYNRDIRPILSDRCFACHGPDAKTREADLRLDTAEGAYAALEGNGGWHQIKPGDPERSEVFYRITTDEEEDMMPPTDSKLPRMTAEEVAKVERWIREGAPYERHWSFVRVERPIIPEAVWPELARNPIDHFVQRKLAEAGVEPAPAADDPTLLRRLHFDLTGLPPAPDRVDSVIERGFSGEEYRSEIDALLRNVQHAEHFAVGWLDKARYADTTGYQYDTPRIMWRWRDWVVEALHRNLPYDQFLTEQFAGDLLPEPTLDQIIATGYNRNHPITIEGGTIEEEYRVQYVSDRVNTIGSSVLGLTMECAKCHDHKYDPISQSDYFRMFAFFNNVPEGGRAAGGRADSPQGALAKPFVLAPSAEQAAEEQHLVAAIRSRQDSVFGESGDHRAAFDEWRESRTQEVGWQVLDASSAESSSGLPFRKLGDLSWLVDSQDPVGGGEVYTFVVPAKGSGWRSLQVEALMHESLPNGGPGRYGNANAVLSKVEIIETGPDGSERPVRLAKVRASYEQEGYPASNLITEPGGTGWGFFHPKMEDRSLVVETGEEFGREGEWMMRVVLTFSQRWHNHTYGRIRLSLSPLPEIRDVPEDLGELLSKPTESLAPPQRESVALAFFDSVDPDEAKAMRADLTALEKLRSEIPPVMVMEEMEVPRPTHVLDRGAYDAPVGEPVGMGAPEALNPFLDEYPENRLGFARWATSRDNPLTARVAVNHLWDRFFGTGIVKTVEDFGSQGEWPSHPELLDWLAVELMESGWDMHHVIRLVLDSHTYRQSSFSRPDVEKDDPANRLLARGPRGRFAAEVVRDQALAVSGLLNPEVGGPGVKPYQPPGIWEELTLRPGFAMSYELSEGDQIYRRSLYTFYKRAAPPAMMSVFDAPSREICTARRESTNTPLQALALLNGETYVEASRALAQNLLRELPQADDEALLREAFERILQRSPHPEELAVVRRVFLSESGRVSEEESIAILSVGRLPLDDSLPQERLLGLTMANRMLFNLSETISRH